MNQGFPPFFNSKSGAVFDSKNRQSQNRPLILLDDFDYIFEGATSFHFATYKNDENIFVLEACFIHNDPSDFKMYTVVIKVASAKFVSAVVRNEFQNYLEGNVNNFWLNQITDSFFDLLPDACTLILIKDSYQNDEDLLLLRKIEFLNKKLEEADKSNSDYIIYVDYIIYHYETIFGNVKYKEIYNCLV